MNKFDALIKRAQQSRKEFIVGVVNPATEESLKATLLATEKKIITPILIGSMAKIKKAAKNISKSLAKYECIDIEDKIAAAQCAINLVKEQKLDAIMKGDILTKEIMREIIAYERERGNHRRMSHCQLIEVPTYNKLMIFTDAAINIYPTLETKKSIIKNAIEFANSLGINTPKIAILAAIENVNENNQPTVDAALLCKMVERSQIKGCEIDGPLSIDLAISEKAAIAKHFTPVLKGQPDIFVVPDLNSGNIAIKIISYLAHGQGAGIVLGAQVPIIITRRSSLAEEYVNSCALAKIAVTRSGLAPKNERLERRSKQ